MIGKSFNNINGSNKMIYELSVTTQGPSYPPSEIMDKDGNFIVIGKINDIDNNGLLKQYWGAALIDSTSTTPAFGENIPYKIIKNINLKNAYELDSLELYTLPLPLPCNNYPITFAPEQKPFLTSPQPSRPLNQMKIPDLRDIDGRKNPGPIYLNNWLKATGKLVVSISKCRKNGIFELSFSKMIPNSLYTIMALREHDLNPSVLTRPGPLGVPNVFVTDKSGNAEYEATMPNPFPKREEDKTNRIINVVILWMSTQMSYGGAIGHFGLGGDIHAQLKLKLPSFFEFETVD